MSDQQEELDFPVTMVRVPGDTEIIRDYTGSFKVAKDWNEYEAMFDIGWRVTQDDAIEAFLTRADSPNIDYLRKRAEAAGVTHVNNMSVETLMDRIAAAESRIEAEQQPKEKPKGRWKKSKAKSDDEAGDGESGDGEEPAAP